MANSRNHISVETLDDFLEEQGLRAETEAVAIKRVLAWQIERAMKEQGVTKTEMAARMKTDRRQLDRLLDPENHSLTLTTLQRAAAALGRQLTIALV
jgi:DNA-binding Xre family transcriptional regulator